MASKTTTHAGGRTSLLSMLFVLFLALKLTHLIDWSWWYVTAPLWIPWAIALFFIGLLAFLKGLLGK